MIIKPTFNVLFWLKKQDIKKDSTIPIYARIRLNDKVVEFSTNESVLLKNWSVSTRWVKNRAPNSQSINTTLAQIKSGLNYAFQQLLDEGEYVTAKAVKLRFLKESKKISKKKRIFILSLSSLKSLI